MIYFVEKTKRYKSGYLGYAIEVDRSEPFDIAIDSDWRLWLPGPEKHSVKYRSGGLECIDEESRNGQRSWLIHQNIVNDEGAKYDDLRLEVINAAGRRDEIFIGAELGEERSHFFLSSSAGSAPAQYALSVILCFHNLAQLPGVEAWVETLRDLDEWARSSVAQLCPDANFKPEESSGRFLERAANLRPAPGLWLPFYARKEDRRAFGVLLLRSRGANEAFVATAYLENDVDVLEKGTVLRQSSPSGLEAETAADVPIASVAASTRMAP